MFVMVLLYTKMPCRTFPYIPFELFVDSKKIYSAELFIFSMGRQETPVKEWLFLKVEGANGTVGEGNKQPSTPCGKNVDVVVISLPLLLPKQRLFAKADLGSGEVALLLRFFFLHFLNY